MQITQEHREQARHLKVKKAMSATASARLRSINDAERATKESNKKFGEQFAKLPKDTWTLHRLLQRCSSDQTNLSRRALKLRRALANGWGVTCPADVLFFAELTLDEERISEDAFYDLMTANWPRPAVSLPEVTRSRGRLSVKQTVLARLAARADGRKIGSAISV